MPKRHPDPSTWTLVAGDTDDENRRGHSFLYIAFVRSLQVVRSRGVNNRTSPSKVVMLRHEVAVLRRHRRDVDSNTLGSAGKPEGCRARAPPTARTRPPLVEEVHQGAVHLLGCVQPTLCGPPSISTNRMSFTSSGRRRPVASMEGCGPPVPWTDEQGHVDLWQVARKSVSHVRDAREGGVCGRAGRHLEAGVPRLVADASFRGTCRRCRSCRRRTLKKA